MYKNIYIKIYKPCYGEFHSPQSPVRNTTDRNLGCFRNMLKLCQHELLAIAGDGSKTASTVPDN